MEDDDIRNAARTFAGLDDLEAVEMPDPMDWLRQAGQGPEGSER